MSAACLPAACEPAAYEPALAGRGDTVVLIASRAFADSDHAGFLLDELAASTDILGPARFELVAAPQARAPDLARVLGEWAAARGDEASGVRAVIAIVGDLSTLQGIDPSLPDRQPGALTSRALDLPALDAALAELARAAGRLGAPLLAATAPLGRQGRIEVPELIEVAEHLRQGPGVIDLQAAFLELEASLLFTNRIDRLDLAGHEELARAVYLALCEDPGPIAPRTDDERRARAQARALQRLARGGEPETAPADVTVAASAPTEAPTEIAARSAVRAAALSLAIDGPVAARKRWPPVPPEHAIAGGAIPGRAIPGRALLERILEAEERGPPPAESFELGLVTVLDAVHARDPQAARMASDLVGRHPDRVEAWMLLELAGILASPPTEVRDEARRQLALYPRSVVPAEVAGRLLDDWPGCLNALPALYLAAQPFAEFTAASVPIAAR